MRAIGRGRLIRSVSLVLRDSLLSLLQGANERLPSPVQGETIFPVHLA
jgi:hypothetical protein